MKQLTIDELDREAEKDCIVTLDNLADKQMGHAHLRQKWAMRYQQSRWKLLLLKEKREKRFDELLHEEQRLTKVSRTSAERKVTKHPDIVDLDKKFSHMVQYSEHLKHVEDVVKNMTWDFRNLIEIVKLQDGAIPPFTSR